MNDEAVGRVRRPGGMGVVTTTMSEGCMTGCYWHGSSECSLCGARLRCVCGCYLREDNTTHEQTCRVLGAMASDECEHGTWFGDFCGPCSHQPAEEWAGYPMTICSFCGVPWPCPEAKVLAS